MYFNSSKIFKFWGWFRIGVRMHIRAWAHTWLSRALHISGIYTDVYVKFDVRTVSNNHHTLLSTVFTLLILFLATLHLSYRYRERTLLHDVICLQLPVSLRETNTCRFIFWYFYKLASLLNLIAPWGDSWLFLAVLPLITDIDRAGVFMMSFVFNAQSLSLSDQR